MPSRKDAPAPPDGYVVSFTPFHERGLTIPPHPFFQGLLHHYQIELHAGHHPVQWKGAPHQRRHPPHVIYPDDTSPVEAMVLQDHDGVEDNAHSLLLLPGRSP